MIRQTRDSCKNQPAGHQRPDPPVPKEEEEEAVNPTDPTELDPVQPPGSHDVKKNVAAMPVDEDPMDSSDVEVVSGSDYYDSDVVHDESSVDDDDDDDDDDESSYQNDHEDEEYNDDDDHDDNYDADNDAEVPKGRTKRVQPKRKATHKKRGQKEAVPNSPLDCDGSILLELMDYLSILKNLSLNQIR